MHQLTPQTENKRSPLRTLQILFTVLAFVSLMTGSVYLILAWFGDGSVSLFGVTQSTNLDAEGKFFVMVFLFFLTLFVVWLLSTIALLLAKRWLAAVLAIPITLVAFIGSYLLLVFIMPMTTGVFFVLLLLLLNVGALWLARRFLISTNSRVSY